MTDTATIEHQEVVPADKRYRRNLFIIYSCLIAFGAVIWRWGVPCLTGLVYRLPVKSRVEMLESIAHAILLLFIPAAIYLIIIGRKVCTLKVMPYPGMKVIRDTAVVHGKRALMRGRSMVLLGVVLIALVIISIIRTHFIILRMKHHPIFSRIFYGVEV